MRIGKYPYRVYYKIIIATISKRRYDLPASVMMMAADDLAPRSLTIIIHYAGTTTCMLHKLYRTNLHIALDWYKKSFVIKYGLGTHMFIVIGRFVVSQQ